MEGWGVRKGGSDLKVARERATRKGLECWTMAPEVNRPWCRKES